MKLKKKMVALFCLLVLSMQMLPVRQIGAILSSNQLTEEIPHTPAGKEFAKGDPLLSDPFLEWGESGECTRNSSKISFLHFATLLPSCHAGEIPTPPPNPLV